MPKRGYIFKGRVISLFTKAVKLPNGHKSRIEIIEHPGAVLIVPFLAENKLILLRQFRPVIGKYIYEFPAGTLNKGEGPLKCARRELEEETGFTAKKIKKIAHIYPVPGYSTETIHIFKAHGLSKKSAVPDKDEVIKTFVMTKEILRGMFRQAKITDAKTICAAALCGLLR